MSLFTELWCNILVRKTTMIKFVYTDWSNNRAYSLWSVDNAEMYEIIVGFVII